MKAYLGDGVYIQALDSERLVLTTENGIDVTNRIVLEPKVRVLLEEFIVAWHHREAGS